jgi:hypothetical protein
MFGRPGSAERGGRHARKAFLPTSRRSGRLRRLSGQDRGQLAGKQEWSGMRSSVDGYVVAGA